MNKSAKILIVDDEEFNVTIIEEFLSEFYQNIESAVDGIECLKKLENYTPDLILLDVSMPKLSGYDVCKQIKANPNLKDIAVIFVSAGGTVEERMAGFDAGGEDYIVKPFHEDELLEKIKKTLEYRSSISELKFELDDAKKVAFGAMMGNAETGYVVQYLRSLFQLSSIEEIMATTLEFSQLWELEACIKIVSHGEEVYGSLSGAVSPLEKNIMELLKNQGRIYSFDNRTQFNFENINMLVKAMPKDDEQKYGRLIDNIPIAIEGAESCIKALAFKKEAESKSLIENKVNIIDGISTEISQSIEIVQQSSNAALKKLYDTLEQKLPFMGLEEDQEALISNSTDEVITVVKEALKTLENVDNHLKDIKRLIN